MQTRALRPTLLPLLAALASGCAADPARQPFPSTALAGETADPPRAPRLAPAAPAPLGIETGRQENARSREPATAPSPAALVASAEGNARSRGSSRPLRIHPDGRIEYSNEEATLSDLLVDFDARTGGGGGDSSAWSQLLDGFDRVLAAGASPPRLELLRAAAACEASLARLRERDPALAASLEEPIASRLAALEEALYAPPADVDGLATPSGPRLLRAPLQPLIVTSFFGLRADPIDGRSRYHFGLDLEASTGQTVRAAAGGKVVSAGWAGGHGNRVEVDHGDGTVTGYSHLSAIRVARGATIAAGTIVGLAGSTGRATGPHLHFEVWRDGEPENPLGWIEDAPVQVHASTR